MLGVRNGRVRVRAKVRVRVRVRVEVGLGKIPFDEAIDGGGSEGGLGRPVP